MIQHRYIVRCIINYKQLYCIPYKLRAPGSLVVESRSVVVWSVVVGSGSFCICEFEHLNFRMYTYVCIFDDIKSEPDVNTLYLIQKLLVVSILPSWKAKTTGPKNGILLRSAVSSQSTPPLPELTSILIVESSIPYRLGKQNNKKLQSSRKI